MRAHYACDAWRVNTHALDAPSAPRDDRRMAGKKKRDSIFTDQQTRVLISTIEKARKRFKNQEARGRLRQRVRASSVRTM